MLLAESRVSTARPDGVAGVRMSRPFDHCRSVAFPPSHWPSREDYLRLLLVNHRAQLLPSIAVCLLMIQTHPLLYPGDNRHSSTLPTSFSPTHSIPPPPSSTNLARTSIYSRMVYPSSMPRFQASQLWPNRCSYGVSLAPTVTAIPWTHTTQRLSTGEKTASRSQQETPEKKLRTRIIPAI